MALCLTCLSWTPSQNPPVSSKYEKWLNEEVVYIITPLEKEVFSKLQNDRERELFIEAFWKHRDRTPDTPENESRAEHYRRLNYATRSFAYSSPLPGWKTDRGRIYILLGQPNDIQKYDGKANLYPCEIWFYQGKEDLGLPPGFNLLFFKEKGQGDYKLYSPSRDGPQALLPMFSGNPMDYAEAYSALREIEPEVADVSLSLIPGQETSAFGRPTLASDILIQKVENVLRGQVGQSYAQRFLQYKDAVDVEYTANYIESGCLVKIHKEPSGLTFVHYAIEPEQLSLNMNDNGFHTTLEINGRVTTSEGKTIYQFDRSIPIRLDSAQMDVAEKKPFDLVDMFPLIPGTYRLSVLMKNQVSKEFTSLEQVLLIPGSIPAVQMTSPILGYKVERADSVGKWLKPFQVGTHQVFCQPDPVFTTHDTLSVAFQIFGLDERQQLSALVRYVFSHDGQVAIEKERRLSEYVETPDILEEFPLVDFEPAHYGLMISVTADGQELLASHNEFDVAFQAAVPRPWFSSRQMPEAASPVYAFIIGTQLFNSDRLEEARVMLERAHEHDPGSADISLQLARLYLRLDEWPKIPAILGPFLDAPKSPRYDVYFLAAQIYEKLGDFAGALSILNQTISYFGVNTSLLNQIGDCHFQLGRLDDALSAWKKSLELKADQPEIAKKVTSLKLKREKHVP